MECVECNRCNQLQSGGLPKRWFAANKCTGILMQNNFQERVEQAAEVVLKHTGSVGPLELFQQMGFLQSFHVESWRKAHELYPVLQPWIQVGPEKFQKTIRHFQEWVKQRGLRPIEATYTRRGPGGIEQLRVTEDGDPEWEKFYRTHYTPAGFAGEENRAACRQTKPAARAGGVRESERRRQLQRVRRRAAPRGVPVDGERPAALPHVRRPGRSWCSCPPGTRP